MQPKGGDSVEIWTRRLNKLFAESQETYRDIAKATGIPISAIHRYVTGETENIPLDRLEQLAAHFGVKTEYLAGWDREPDAVDRKVLEIDPEFVPGKGYLPENNNDINIYREKMRRQTWHGCVSRPGSSTRLRKSRPGCASSARVIHWMLLTAAG